jgi:hypothetical protein
MQTTIDVCCRTIFLLTASYPCGSGPAFASTLADPGRAPDMRQATRSPLAALAAVTVRFDTTLERF